MFAVLGAISSHGPARCNVVNLDGLVHHDQQIVDTDLSDHTQAGEALRRVVRHGGCEHPWTYWLRADGCCVAACHISTVLVADPEAETRLNDAGAKGLWRSPGAAGVAMTQQPNILLIMSDQLHAGALGFAGATHADAAS